MYHFHTDAQFLSAVFSPGVYLRVPSERDKMYFSAFVFLVLFLVVVTNPCSAQNAYCTAGSSPYSSTNLDSYPLANQPTPAPNGPELTTSNLVDTSQQAVRDYIVKKHNCLRTLPSPTAANMLKIQWNAEAAAGAQQHANNCVFQHNSNANRTTSQFGCGQNIAEVGGDTPMTWKYAIDLWYNEVESCTDGTAASCTAGDVIGHYTQVVWAKSWQIGCGWANCPAANMNFYVCNYCPALLQESPEQIHKFWHWKNQRWVLYLNSKMTFTSHNGTLPSSSAVISLMVLSSWGSNYFYPAYEVAIEESNIRYGHLFRWEILRVRDPKVYGCPDTTIEMNNMVGKFYYSNLSRDNRNVLALTDSKTTTACTVHVHSGRCLALVV